MVKVVELSEKEMQEQERTSRLESITKRLFPEARVNNNQLSISVFIEGEHALSTMKERENNYSILLVLPNRSKLRGKTI